MTSDTYISLTAIVLLLVSFVLFLKENKKVQTFFTLLMVLFSLHLLQKDIAPIETGFFVTGLVGGFLALNLVIASFIKNKLRWIAPVVSILIIFFVGKSDLMYKEYALDFSSIKVVATIVLGFLAGVIACILSRILKPFFNESEPVELTTTTVLLGLFIIPVTFFVSNYGILLLASGYFLYNIYNVQKRDFVVVGLLSLAVVSTVAKHYSIDGIDLSIGKVIAGLVVGSGAYLLGVLALKATNKLVGLGLIMLGIISVALITSLNNVHPAYGGTESLLAAFFGMAIASLLIGKNELSNIFFPALLTIGFLLPSDPFAETGDQPTDSVSTTQTPTSDEPKGLDASVLSGKFKVVSKTAVISFQLGPKGGITKGAIKEFEGNVDFGSDIKNAKFSIKLPTKKLTTFNSMRDESILGGAYLNASKFPMMSFSSSTMEPKEDGYMLNGAFTMLGITNNEEIFIKYMGEKEGKQQFSGKAAIDRTKYGMASSPQEGNLVDFTFTMELE